MKEEVCQECSRIIGIAEQAYVYEGRIVCEQCNKKLRQKARQDQGLQDTWIPEEVAELRESEEIREPEESQEILEDTEVVESLGIQEPEEFAELQEPKEPQEVQERETPIEFLESQEAEEPSELEGLQDIWKPEEIAKPKESEGLPEPEEPEEFAEFKEPEVTPVDPESKEAFESLEIPEPEELQVPEISQEPEETPEVRKSEEPVESLKAREPEDFAEFHEFGEPGEIKELQEPKEPKAVMESGKLFRTLRMPETEELEGFPESEELEEYKKPEKLRELIEAPAGPLEDEQVARVLASAPSPRKRKRIKRTKSTLLGFLLTAWSLLCLFLLFYVPGRYADLLRNSAFGKRYQLGGAAVDCLILFLMVLWFLGALALFVIATGLQKDRLRARS